VVLVPGLAPAGRDDPRLIALAGALARARFAVLVPEIASLRAQQVGPDDIADIAGAIAFLRDPSAGLQSRQVGVIGISYAVGPALLATLGEASDGRPDFLVGVGGYYAIDAVVTFFTTGFYRDPPATEWRHREPNEYGKWVFLASNATALSEAKDRTTLRAISQRRQTNPGAAVDDLVAGLGPEGRAVYALIDNRDPERVPSLIAGLPPQVRNVMSAIDLRSRDLSAAPPRILLIHGRDDPIIPASESRALAAALPVGSTHLVIVENLAHADLSPAGLWDALRLWRAAYRLLSWRDGAS
jgi:pimeloyl-ACP methyl ester carboxylesterase